MPLFVLIGVLIPGRYQRDRLFVAFIGYPRSGHTLLGSLMDAHRMVAVSIEANALQMIQLGYNRNGLLFFIEFWSWFVSRILGNKWSGYSYKVPGGFQGKSSKSVVMGDNDANQTTQRLMGLSELEFTLKNRLSLPVKYIHVVRNPFDIISTMHNRKVGNFSRESLRTEGDVFDQKVLEKKTRAFFRKAKKVQQMISSENTEVLTIYHESLISSPRETLETVFEFLEIAPSDEYLDKCMQTIHKSSNKSRHKVLWRNEYIKKVERKCLEIPFLKEYRFAD